ncbi:hypothetical protein EJ07DRAFT_160652 [Lizonia empirigonia]|nr:hypothetical protein EJ07DRAFT_160652 [Lizonia empirigonia]
MLDKSEKEKHAMYVQDLYAILHALWVNDTKPLHGLVRVQISLLLLLSAATATRPGAIVESASAKGSNKALSFKHIEILKSWHNSKTPGLDLATLVANRTSMCLVNKNETSLSPCSGRHVASPSSKVRCRPSEESRKKVEKEGREEFSRLKIKVESISPTYRLSLDSYVRVSAPPAWYSQYSSCVRSPVSALPQLGTPSTLAVYRYKRRARKVTIDRQAIRVVFGRIDGYRRQGDDPVSSGLNTLRGSQGDDPVSSGLNTLRGSQGDDPVSSGLNTLAQPGRRPIEGDDLLGCSGADTHIPACCPYRRNDTPDTHNAHASA